MPECPVCAGSGQVNARQLMPPEFMADERHREVCSTCGKRRMTMLYGWGLPGVALTLCSECDPWNGKPWDEAA